MATPDRKKATKGLKFLGRALSELDPYDFAINLTLGNGTETQLEIENASDMVLGPRDRVHKDTDWTEWLPSALDIDLVAGQRKNEYYSMHKDGVKKVTVTFISTSEGDRTGNLLISRHRRPLTFRSLYTFWQSVNQHKRFPSRYIVRRLGQTPLLALVHGIGSSCRPLSQNRT